LPRGRRRSPGRHRSERPNCCNWNSSKSDSIALCWPSFQIYRLFRSVNLDLYAYDLLLDMSIFPVNPDSYQEIVQFFLW
jgi:hypothetical protein